MPNNVFAKLSKVKHYNGLYGFKAIEKVLGTEIAEKIGWWKNRSDFYKGISGDILEYREEK